MTDADRDNGPDLDRIFLALADATRRDILLTLRASPASVGELVARSTLTQPAISKHLKVLEEAGLIRRERDGRRIYSVIEPAPLVRAAVFVSRFETNVEANLDRLDALLARGDDRPPQDPTPQDPTSRNRTTQHPTNPHEERQEH